MTGLAIASAELYLRYDGYALVADGLYDRGFVRNTGTLDNLVGIQYPVESVAPLFELYLLEHKARFILLFELSRVGEEDVEPLFARENSATETALSASQYHDLHLSYL